MTIQIRAFASAGQIIGERNTSMEISSGSTVAQVWEHMVNRHAALAGLTSTIAFGLNDQLTSKDTILADGDRLDLLPPVSGG